MVTTTPLPCEPCSECSTGATVGVAVVLSLIIVGLIIALAIVGRLYRKLRGSAAAKSLMYTAEGKTPGWTDVFLFFSEITSIFQNEKKQKVNIFGTVYDLLPKIC